jgi:transposase
VTDLSLSGRLVQLLVIARRFRCDAVLCGRQIFTERFAEEVLAPSARRTARLDDIVHHLGLALGGRPAAGFAKRLMLPVSKDTLLRVVRRRSRPPADPLRVIGIDDWAWRRNHRYASIICNLERRRIVTLLPDRESATPKPGSLLIQRSRSSPVTVVEDMAKPRQRPCRTRYRSQIVGI